MHDDKLNPSAGSDEGAMARADLYKLANYSKKLFHLIHDEQELEGWIQAKITKAADYIASVYHYLEYEMKVSEYGERLENSDVYSESVKRAFQQKLFEARLKLKKVKEKNEKEVKEVVDQDDIEAARKRHAEKTGKDYEPKKAKKDNSRRVVKGKSYGGSKQKDDDLDEDFMGSIARGLGAGMTSGTMTSGIDKEKNAADLAFADKITDPVDQERYMKAFNKIKDSRSLRMASPATQSLNFSDERDFKKLKQEMAKKYNITGIKEVIDRDDIEAARKRHAEKKGKEYEPKKEKKDDSRRVVKGKSYGGSKQKDDDLDEGKKPDFLDMDKDGNKKEPMKKALKDKKLGEVKMAPSPADMATSPPPKGKDGQYPFVTSGPHKGKRWSPSTPGPTAPVRPGVK